MRKFFQKNWAQWFCFLICFILFLSFRFQFLSQKKSSIVLQNTQAIIAPAITLTNTHPWLKIQPTVQGAALEIIRDFERVRAMRQFFLEMSEKELTHHLIDKLVKVQASIPFVFPSYLYNVLCICEDKNNFPIPFHTIKRLYLGETHLGFPFYLDVRDFELSEVSVEEVIARHLDILEGDCREIFSSNRRKMYLCKGNYPSERAHDISCKSDEEYVLLLDFFENLGHLYVAYAEAPLTIFAKHKYLFYDLSKNEIFKSAFK